MPDIKVIHGKCEEVLKDFADNHFDSIVCDPPYGISFMNKHWDYQIPSVAMWEEIIRVLKPGGYLLCACGTRTQHRMAVNIEDAGFEIRDVITWHYGSGFPKSLDVSKAIDKQNGFDRELEQRMRVDGKKATGTEMGSFKSGATAEHLCYSKEAISDEAKQWEGWGTALKPATEFWTLARKPLSESTVAENVLKHGTGGINIDGCRIEGNDDTLRENKEVNSFFKGLDQKGESFTTGSNLGRFPSNLILDEYMAEELDKQSIANGIHSAGAGRIKNVDSDYNASSYDMSGERQMNRYDDDDTIGASRFFYVAKPSQFERNKGLKGFEKQINGVGALRDNGRESIPRGNNHPTVKPIDLMRYLVKLITPKYGNCLDPFCGSGTTLIGCKLELINAVGIEMDENHCKIAEARVTAWNPERYIEQTLF